MSKLDKIAVRVGDSVVPVPSSDNRTKPSSHFWNGGISPEFQLFLDVLQLGLHTPAHRKTEQYELPVARLGANVREAKEVERFRFALAVSSASLSGESPEFDQACLFAVQRQTEPAKAALQITLKPFRIRLALEARDDIVCVPDHNHTTTSMTTSPLVSPQVEHVVQIERMSRS
jgi:hypothetical protein